MEMLKVATNSWRPSKRHEAQTYLAAIVLSIECLGCNFAGWGDRFPNAKQRADDILNEYLPENRTRLLDMYMPLRAQLDQEQIRNLGPSTGGFAEGKRAREFRNAGGRASGRRRRYAECIIADHGWGHSATKAKPASRVRKLIRQARSTRKIDWCHRAVDVHGLDAVGLEVDVGPVRRRSHRT
jgi:hypothetical protein